MVIKLHPLVWVPTVAYHGLSSTSSGANIARRSLVFLLLRVENLLVYDFDSFDSDSESTFAAQFKLCAFIICLNVVDELVGDLGDVV